MSNYLRYWKRVQAGLCVACGGRPPGPRSRQCDACRQLDTRRHRKAGGFGEWKLGGPGRPPVGAKQGARLPKGVTRG